MSALIDKLMKASPGQLAELYVNTRDRKRNFEAAIRGCNEQLELLDRIILGKMDKLKQDGFRAVGHTVFRHTFVSCRVTEPELFMANILETGDYDLIERRAAKEACEAYAAERATKENPKGVPPPGVTIDEIVKLGVRKGG